MGYHRPGEWAKRADIRKEIGENLRSKLSYGESKYEAKKAGTTGDKIYSRDTYQTYSKACQNFASYVIEHNPNGHNIKLADAKVFAREFIEREIELGKSPYTVKMERAALAKLYGVKGSDIAAVPNRSRADISRSRNLTTISEKTGKEIKNTSTRSGRFSEKNNRDIVDFCKGTGLRRSELSSLKGTQLVERNGRMFVETVGKGGRHREAAVLPGYAEHVEKMMKAAGDGYVFDKVPQHMDVHLYRSQYASELYKEFARPADQIPRKERYCCRGDLKGTWYDKQAMREVSHSLGHNRISVIAEHYLR